MDEHDRLAGASGNGVTWRELYAELRQRDLDQRQRDSDQRDLLEEIRDSLGDMHTSLTSLPCDSHTSQARLLAEQVADLKGHVIDVRAIKKIVPVHNPRVLLLGMGICASILGWDWWPRVQAVIDQAAK